ncbi:hypothetical protein RRG08_003554 [Elysia crispata]|uniref:Uncharacterized protein n=1 Tax=Elysia crispata TaxID=231223 RepID=A0AAE1CU10_9GAST|nr:hypothetical protein RRG08_003554 [Elysia crispata]
MVEYLIRWLHPVENCASPHRRVSGYKLEHQSFRESNSVFNESRSIQKLFPLLRDPRERKLLIVGSSTLPVALPSLPHG